MVVQMEGDLLELYLTGKSGRYKDVARNKTLRDGFFRVVETMKIVSKAEDLKNFSYLHYEQLKYQYSGFCSVRLSNSYIHRLIFREIAGGVEVKLIDIDDTHYGNK